MIYFSFCRDGLTSNQVRTVNIMAKYSITRSCGHDDVVQIFGTNRNGERDRREKWEASKPCDDCAKASREAAHKAANEVSQQAAEKLALPDLLGSEKQVSWATTIRHNLLVKKAEVIEANIASHAAIPERAALAAKNKIDFEAAVAELTAQTSASWWIDNRANEDILLKTCRKYAQNAQS